MLAIDALEPQESVGEDAAFEESFEFGADMLGKVLSFECAQVLEASQVFLHDFVEGGVFGAAPDVAGIVPRKGGLPAMSMAVRICMPMALLLHNGLTLQLQSHGCSRSPPCCPR